MSSVHQSHADVKKHFKKLYAIVGSGYVSKTLRHNLWVPWKHGGNDRRANGRFLTGHTFRIVRNLCHLLNSTRVINLRLNRFDCCESLVIPFFFFFCSRSAPFTQLKMSINEISLFMFVGVIVFIQVLWLMIALITLRTSPFIWYCFPTSVRLE